MTALLQLATLLVALFTVDAQLQGTKTCPVPYDTPVVGGTPTPCFNGDTSENGHCCENVKITPGTDGKEYCKPALIFGGMPEQAPAGYYTKGTEWCGPNPITVDEQREAARNAAGGGARGNNPGGNTNNGNSGNGGTGGGSGGNANCRDGVNRFGVSECPQHREKCTLPVWQAFMEKECPVTCKCAAAGYTPHPSRFLLGNSCNRNG